MSREESKIQLLNAKELIAQTNLYHDIDPGILIRGLKSKYPQNTDEELAIIKSYQGKTSTIPDYGNSNGNIFPCNFIKRKSNILDDLRKMLSMERVALKHDRSIASLENGLIRIVKRQGKWDGFESTGTYLEPHEALFMMEMVCNKKNLAQNLKIHRHKHRHIYTNRYIIMVFLIFRID